MIDQKRLQIILESVCVGLMVNAVAMLSWVVYLGHKEHEEKKGNKR